MKKWLRKSLFVTVSILTFGLVTPTQLMNSVNGNSLSERDVFESPSGTNSFSQTTAYLEESEFDRDKFMQNLLKQAELQSYQKFGSKIKPVIEDEFREIILPNIEIALNQTADQFPEEDLKNLAITEHPGTGHSEKIFNIKNAIDGKDILRFHVRRDNPPQAGYWFNFHYHTHHDEFQNHYELGSIYWDKNTPPKWMS
ncbi:YpjP family protein [Paenibacillus sp. BSR1-1]|uniref:YpjP family protein n=1 Tax=Paenibacillus sp. BSR1-1 TaxID=3020845 RepID=UPI0025B13D95|nr:YpjP family protein [Paenibacillus sp. BSR1-1]MDN3016792.1 YpjP family protein [Paenibacillus sp. BSR1-1]